MLFRSMSVIAIILALLLEQWRPLADRRAWGSLLERVAVKLEASFNAGEMRHGAIAWAVGVVPVIALSLGLYYLLFWFSPILAMLLNVAVLYLTLGFRQFSHYFTGIQLALREDDLDRARRLIGQWRVEDAALGCGDAHYSQRPGVIWHMRADNAAHAKRGIGVGIRHRHVDAARRHRRCAGEIDVDAIARDGELGL